MSDIKCIKCNKLLFKIEQNTKGSIEIKCPKCKELNKYKLEALEAQGN